MGTFWQPSPAARLRRAGRRGLLPSVPQDDQRFSMASAQHQLFPSASDFRLDRRDADHGRARGGGAIHRRCRRSSTCIRWCARASSSTGCWPRSRNAPGIVLYTLLEPELVERLEKTCRELGLPCLSMLGPVLGLFQSYLGGETKPPRRRAAHAQRRIFQAHRRAELHHAARRRPARRRHGAGRRGAGRRVAHLEDADLDLSRQPRRQDRERSAGAGRAGAAAARGAGAAAGGGPDRQPGAHRADPAEPAARASRRARRRAIRRPAGGGGGGRRGAQAVRQAQLADHRRDAPLDRGNRRGGDGAAGRAPPAAPA